MRWLMSYTFQKNASASGSQDAMNLRRGPIDVEQVKPGRRPRVVRRASKPVDRSIGEFDLRPFVGLCVNVLEVLSLMPQTWGPTISRGCRT
jgi:hypothetical protein